MALGGRYRALHDRQYAWEQNRFVNPGEDFTTPRRRRSAEDPQVAPAGR
jgi:hypothetical protein